MKKHEACFHLNKIIAEKRSQMKRYLEPTETAKADGTPRTEQEIASATAWRNEEAAELKLEIEALDIAAESLTKR